MHCSKCEQIVLAHKFYEDGVELLHGGSPTRGRGDLYDSCIVSFQEYEQRIVDEQIIYE
jgi:hypothetical protein